MTQEELEPWQKNILRRDALVAENIIESINYITGKNMAEMSGKEIIEYLKRYRMKALKRLDGSTREDIRLTDDEFAALRPDAAHVAISAIGEK